MSSITSRENQTIVTNLLKDALKTIGLEGMRKLLKSPLELYISSHSTGVQAHIQLAEANRATFTVWRGSIWYESCFSFNDRHKTLGIDPLFGFVDETLTKYFETIQALHAEKIGEVVVETASTQAKQRIDAISDIAYYRNMFK